MQRFGLCAASFNAQRDLTSRHRTKQMTTEDKMMTTWQVRDNLTVFLLKGRGIPQARQPVEPQSARYAGPAVAAASLSMCPLNCSVHLGTTPTPRWQCIHVPFHRAIDYLVDQTHTTHLSAAGATVPSRTNPPCPSTTGSSSIADASSLDGSSSTLPTSPPVAASDSIVEDE